MKEQTQEPMTAEQLTQKTAIDISHAFENKQDEPEATAIEVFQILTERFNQAREELESKMLALTEALEWYSFQDTQKKESFEEWKDRTKIKAGSIAEEALQSTTPQANDIRKRIKAEGFNDGVEAYLKALNEKYNQIDPNTGYRDFKEGIQYGMALAEEIAQSIKKEGK